MGASGPMKVERVLETCLYVDDLQAAKVFYRDLLGLELHSEAPERHTFFRCGSAMLLLFDPRATEASSGEVPAHGAHGPGHVAFAVPQDELGLWRERLLWEQVEIEAEVEWPGGGRSLYVRDPAGNSVELTGPSTWSLSREAGRD